MSFFNCFAIFLLLITLLSSDSSLPIKESNNKVVLKNDKEEIVYRLDGNKLPPSYRIKSKNLNYF